MQLFDATELYDPSWESEAEKYDGYVVTYNECRLILRMGGINDDDARRYARGVISLSLTDVCQGAALSPLEVRERLLVLMQMPEQEKNLVRERLKAYRAKKEAVLQEAASMVFSGEKDAIKTKVTRKKVLVTTGEEIIEEPVIVVEEPVNKQKPENEQVSKPVVMASDSEPTTIAGTDLAAAVKLKRLRNIENKKKLSGGQ